MRLFVSFAALLGLLLACTSALEWDEYKAKYNKQYRSPAEESLRHAIYQRNLAEIEAHNSLEEKSFERGINHLSDLTRAEYLKLNGLRVPDVVPKFDPFSFPAELIGEGHADVPEAVDWSQRADRVAPVKNQGKCGSCWSFATTGLLEGQEFKKVNRSVVVPLSEQELIDCDDLDQGCGGGWPSNALDFIRGAGGLKTEHDYPYLSGQGDDTFECLFEPKDAEVSTRHIKRYHMLPEGDEQLLKRVVAGYGPVAVAFDASQEDFHAYKSGVYYNEHCKNGLNDLDHAVLLVGYGTCPEQGDYWILKNSWSEEWGERGYFKMARNRDNHCGVATAATIVAV